MSSMCNANGRTARLGTNADVDLTTPNRTFRRLKCYLVASRNTGDRLGQLDPFRWVSATPHELNLRGLDEGFPAPFDDACTLRRVVMSCCCLTLRGLRPMRCTRVSFNRGCLWVHSRRVRKYRECPRQHSHHRSEQNASSRSHDQSTEAHRQWNKGRHQLHTPGHEWR